MSQMSPPETTASAKPDIAIVGAGPVGLFAVFACGMLGLKCAVIDALPDIGGQCRALYPDKPIYDIPAYPAISGGDLIDKLSAQAAPFAPQYYLNQTVTDLRGDVTQGFTIATSMGSHVMARAVIIAGGNGSFAPQKPPLAGIESYEASGAVVYTVLDTDKFRDKHVVIAGGGDTAVDWALLLETLAASVTLVHRRDKFRAAPASVAKLQEKVAINRIQQKIPYQLHALNGDGIQLSTVVLEDGDGQKQTIPADILLPCFGIAAALGAIGDWGLALMRNQISVELGTGQTTIPGLYAIGDMAHYPHKLRLIATGFAEAIQTAHAIYNQLHPDKPLHFVHSTDKGVPQC